VAESLQTATPSIPRDQARAAPPGTDLGRRAVRTAVRRLVPAMRSPAATLVVVVAVLTVLITAANPTFLTPDNLITLLRAAVTTFIIGCAATVVFASGALDLSVGAVFTMGGVVVGGATVAGVPWPVAALLGVGAGALLGLVNAALVIAARVPPIIATLGTFYAVGGLAVIVTNGSPISPLPDGFNAMGQGSVVGVPLLILYGAVVGVLVAVLLATTRFGYDAKAVGGNENAARANGVRVTSVKTRVYALSGAAAALAGVLYAARTGTADPQAGGADLTFNVITAVLIGGTSLFGGIGTVAGTALGAVLFAQIQNGLILSGVNPLYSNVVVGVILVAAVALDGWRRSRAFRVGRGG